MLSPHIRAQALRFLRLFAAGFIAQLAVTGTEHLGWKVLASIAIGAGEAAVRQVWPTAPLPAATPLPTQAVIPRPSPLDPPGT